MSTRGFEPPTPGFIPLRLSPPQSVRGLDCPFTVDLSVFRCCPSSLYTFTRFLWSLARDWHAGMPAKRSPTLSRSIAEFPTATPNYFRNPVLYPAELRGHTNAPLSYSTKLSNCLREQIISYLLRRETIGGT